MSGRQQERIRKRVTADVRVGEKQFKGLIVDLSAAGLFVQMEAATLPPRGIEVELEFAESSFGPPMTLRGEVVRRSLSNFGSAGARGVGVRIVEAPPEYHEAIAGLLSDRQPPRFADAGELEVDFDVDVELELELDPEFGGPAGGEACRDLLTSRSPLAGPTHAPTARAGGGLGAGLLGSSDASDVPRVPGLPTTRVPTPEPAPLVLPPDADDPRRNDVFCVYDGDELDDVFRQLEELGARPQRARLSGPTRFAGWDVPPRLFVTSASEALRIELPDTLRGETLRIAVADSSSEVLGSLVARIGYDYLIRRPVHPQMLRLLFQRLLYDGEDVRRHERHEAGWPVQLAVGWRALGATLLDLSGGGARLLIGGDVDLLAEVRLRVPRTSRQRAISLPARVIRKRRHSDGTWSLALRFVHDVNGPTFDALQRRLDGGAIGPAARPPTPLIERVLAWWRSRRLKGARPIEEVAASEAVDRRRIPRVELDREILDLDPDTHVPRHVLVGRDLSIWGLRVDPHPDLRVGENVWLALFDSSGAPLELTARVARDEGDRGWLLEFVDIAGTIRPRLQELIHALPPIEQLGGGESQGVVLARIDTDRVAAAGLAR